jgi:drug/metabolite transporter, DME family
LFFTLHDRELPLNDAKKATESPPAPAMTVVSARWLVILAGLLWSSAGFFGKSELLKDLQGGPLAVWRAVFAGIVLLPLVRKPYFSLRLLPMLICFAAMTYTYLQAFKYGPAANAIWLQSTAPAWVLLAERFIFKSKIAGRDYAMMALCLTGIGIILAFELLRSQTSSLATFLGIISGVFYASVVLNLKRLSHEDPYWLASLNNIFTAGVLFCILPIVGDFKTPQGYQWPLIAAFGAFQLGLPYALFSRALRVLPSHEGSAIVLIEPILVPVWAYLTMGEKTPPWTIAGASLIFAGLIMKLAIPERKPVVEGGAM